MRSGILILMAAVLLGSIGAAFHIFAPDNVAATRGRVLYDANCAACHGQNLEGQPDWRSPRPDGRFPAPPHDAAGHTWHHSDTALIDYITLGGEEALAQMGVSFDSAMPAFGDVLSTQEIADILAYIKSRWPDRERQFQAERSASDGG
ncbi:cytochrome c [Pseudorhodobacter sp.]|uniref:c-type cytochrome n=1 Tax=Pseudorhodobacter sp. TaxID=1934400 RepID=UPI002647EC5E|nr:cytochrome c [Pseudorhodobacter sp.]MDN5788587.1 cytochrome c [Pseudorhodobacter sp.]